MKKLSLGAWVAALSLCGAATLVVFGPMTGGRAPDAPVSALTPAQIEEQVKPLAEVLSQQPFGLIGLVH